MRHGYAMSELEKLTIYDLLARLVKERQSESDGADRPPVVYDLGCGSNKAPGAIGVDLYSSNADTIHDLESGDWSFCADGSVDVFYASHYLEHVHELERFMDKAHRKLKAGGYFLITTPYGASPRAWQDPDHVRAIFRETYWYFNAEWREKNGVSHYSANCDFDIVGMYPVWHPDFADKSEAAKEYAMEHVWNAVLDLTVILKKR
jgi:SAM-dependent methyltransferase